MKSVATALPNLEMNLRQTDSLLEKVPDEALAHRPGDKSGAFQFSVAEIFAHIGDSRAMFAAVYLEGVPYTPDPEPGTYLLTPPGEEGVWGAPDDLGRPVLESHLRQGRDALAEAFGSPAPALLQPTKGGVVIHAAAVARREEGRPGPNDDLILSWGPANLARVLLTWANHEAGHRGAIISLVRGLGVSLTR